MKLQYLAKKYLKTLNFLYSFKYFYLKLTYIRVYFQNYFRTSNYILVLGVLNNFFSFKTLKFSIFEKFSVLILNLMKLSASDEFTWKIHNFFIKFFSRKFTRGGIIPIFISLLERNIFFEKLRLWKTRLVMFKN
jgi:hypothetical protein